LEAKIGFLRALRSSVFLEVLNKSNRPPDHPR
jgi:hypothetical protein